MRLSIIILFFLSSQIAVATSLNLKSPVHQVGLLELYTSEGCSSCPPADRWLSELKNNDKLWNEIVPIAFHVDYWDYIGWKDRFASAEYSKRQRDYATEASLKTVYTPGFLYNGKEWRNWFVRRFFDFPEGGKPGVLAVDVNDKTAQVSFSPLDKNHKNLKIHVALIGFDVTTAVKAGENRGRSLHHDFVVLGMHQTVLQSANKHFTATIDIPKSKVNAPKYGIVAWVSANNSQRPVQAVGGVLPGN